MSAVQVYNHDVVGLYNRMNRFIVELIKSVSSNVSEMNQFDQERLDKYLGAIDAYHGWVIGQPQLDLPETAPRVYELEAVPAIVDAENEAVNDIVRIMVIARDELINSQSAREPAGFNVFDSGRLTAVITKVRAFLNDFIRAVTPLDLPESSPQSPSTGSGIGGI